MRVDERTRVLADHEQVIQPLVHDLEIAHRLVGHRIFDVKFELDIHAGLQHLRRGHQPHRILMLVRDARHQRHAAAGTLARRLRPDVLVHGADELDLGILRHAGPLGASGGEPCCANSKARREGRSQAATSLPLCSALYAKFLDRRHSRRWRGTGSDPAKRCAFSIASPNSTTHMFDWGGEYYLHHGRMMPDDALDSVDEIRRDPARRHRPSRHSGPHHVERPAAAHPPHLRSIRERPAGDSLSGRRLPARESGRDRYGRGAGKYRRRVRASRRLSLSSPARRSRDSDRCLHPPWNRARGPPRLRARRAPQWEAPRDVHHQIQRARLRDGSLGPHIRDSGRRFPGHRNRVPAGRCSRDELRPPPAQFRRGGRVQPVRRHPERSFRDSDGQHRPRCRARISIRRAAIRPCSSRCTARPPISRAGES